jgi:hypothetical protein
MAFRSIRVKPVVGSLVPIFHHLHRDSDVDLDEAKDRKGTNKPQGL